VLDEIHRLADPSTLLKIAADHFPDVHVLATGSSMLGASARFRDTLAGRKRTVRLLPVLHRELPAFGIRSPERRLLHGGLPEQLTAPGLPEKDFTEWIEAFWARDILALFSIGKRYSFLRFLELLWSQCGGLCELTSFTAACEASRQTLANYLDIFAATGVVHVLRPFATNPTREIVAMPKVYAFDTGFVCHARSIDSLRADDKGPLFEDVFELNDNWFLSPEGLGFSFDPYEIGPYAAGFIELVIPYSKLKAWVKPGSALARIVTQ
jgi:predicted AAA+ superfamily ATPase